MYYLLDLERSIQSGRLVYWKKNKHGYTTIVEEAGLYNVDDAVHIANADMDNYTVMVDETVVDKLLS